MQRKIFCGRAEQVRTIRERNSTPNQIQPHQVCFMMAVRNPGASKKTHATLLELLLVRKNQACSETNKLRKIAPTFVTPFTLAETLTTPAVGDQSFGTNLINISYQ